MSEMERDRLAEIITVLAEVRRVARQLEADRKVTMSRGPRILSELYETLLVMYGDMTVSITSFYEEEHSASVERNLSLIHI